MKIETYDTTLRDGAQCAGISFTYDDRVKIIRVLDSLGISYIEAGMVSNMSDAETVSKLALEAKNSKVAAFGATRRAYTPIGDDAAIHALASTECEVITVYGKSWQYQVERVLGCSLDENLAMISDTVRYFCEMGREVIFDAEHYFDGYSDSPEYALRVLETARDAGASRVVLCDTNGGMLTDAIGIACEAAQRRIGSVCGIHTHNDLGMAVAASVSGVLSGAVHVQGTVSGIGERCGNANLNTLIPLLQLKLGFQLIPSESMAGLSTAVRHINEIANRTFDEHEPFVGGYAFTHKAGSHIDGVIKAPRSFEHIDPSSVGNERNMIISSLSGRAAVADKLKAYLPSFSSSDKDNCDISSVLSAIKEKEKLGYTYDDAEASLALVIDEALGKRCRYFELLNLKVMTDTDTGVSLPSNELVSFAMIKISVGGETTLSAAEGNGPVNAMDRAMRKALLKFFPAISGMRLSDYKVRVISSETTESVVRVVIETTDGIGVWRTVGVSRDIINASWQALCDSVEYFLGKKQQIER